MPISERVRRYREMAAVACDLADKTPSVDSKENYVKLASAWQHLATQLENEMFSLKAET